MQGVQLFLSKVNRHLLVNTCYYLIISGLPSLWLIYLVNPGGGVLPPEVPNDGGPVGGLACGGIIGGRGGKGIGLYLTGG